MNQPSTQHSQQGNAACTCAANAASDPTNFRGFSAFTLKIIAIIGMTCNHAAYVFQPQLSFAAQNVLFAVGGVTFPIMAYLLVEGYKHTSNLKKYAGRLAIFAAISQAPYWMFLDHNGNVMITLLLALIALWLYDAVRNRTLFWMLFVALTVASFWCDWGVFGPIMALMFYVLQKHAGPRTAAMPIHDTKAHRESVIRTMLVPITADGLVRGMELLRSVAALPFFLYAAVGNTAAMALLLCYNGQRGRSLKWLFYVYYPLHITVLGLAAKLIL